MKKRFFIGFFFCFVFLIANANRLFLFESGMCQRKNVNTKIQIWLLVSVADALEAHGKGFTPTLDATAGTHSCLNRMLMKEKHRKSLGFGIHTRTHTCTHGVLFSVHRCWYALHHQIVCKSVQKVTVRLRVREDLDASGATRGGQAELTNSRRQMLRDTKGVGGGGLEGLSSDSNTFPCVMLGVSTPQGAHLRPRQLSSVGPLQSALAPTPPLSLSPH